MLSQVSQNVAEFESADKMMDFVSQSMAEADLSGSYNTGVLSMSGTAQAMTGSTSDITTAFHTTHMDIEVVTHVVDFQQSSTCFSESNVDSSFLTRFKSLALISGDDVAADATWSPHVEFLKDNGSHVMMQQQIGSRFQQWESSTSSDSQISTTLQIKACAEVEGTGSGGGWSVSSCGGYSSDQKQTALQTQSQSTRLILGSTDSARSALTKAVNQQTLDAFIDGADQGTEAIRFIFKPIWELLIGIYEPACATAGTGSDACNNLQRAVALQAAYEGWTAIGCPQAKTTGNSVYQAMRTSGPTSLGIYTYECWVAKTGCLSDDDCHLGGAGSVCYCYGSGCLDTGDAISGTSMYRDKVRGDESGSYDEGVNNSCYYHFLAHCDCDTGWSGGLASRNLYQQSAPGGLTTSRSPVRPAVRRR